MYGKHSRDESAQIEIHLYNFCECEQSEWAILTWKYRSGKSENREKGIFTDV